MSEKDKITRRDQLDGLIRVAKFKPVTFAAIVAGGVFAALLEGIGIGFILPIIELVQSSGNPTQEADGIFLAFVSVYRFLGVPFSLGSVVTGVALILTIRWTMTFVVRWLREVMLVKYKRELQTQAFERALNARITYFDQEGSDDILNAIVTQAERAGKVVSQGINLMEQSFLTVVYLLIALALSPMLTVIAAVFLGGLTVLFRNIFESGYDIGDRVADANEGIQQTAQAGTQGIRDTKLFGMKEEHLANFRDSIDQFARASIRSGRNRQGIKNFYNLLTAVSVFLMVYLAINFANMSISTLGIFLFAMFRLGPKASNLNTLFYSIENNLPHLVRTQKFIDRLNEYQELSVDEVPVPDTFDRVEFDGVWFSYPGQDEYALRGLSLEFEKGEFIGLVGQSGAGKSTVMSLIARMYEPDRGEIRVNEASVSKMDIDAYRSRIAVVRQDPFIFNETLRYNLTIGNRNATQEEIERVTHIARIDHFLDELPEGYDTELGDEGVRLSGGQQQRVALGRALLKDADLLVLDEATSDLDSNLEMQVQSAIESMDRNYAIVAIAHRLSTLQNADRIYTMEHGEVTEVGDHESLLENDGKYAELHAIQSKSG